MRLLDRLRLGTAIYVGGVLRIGKTTTTATPTARTAVPATVARVVPFLSRIALGGRFRLFRGWRCRRQFGFRRCRDLFLWLDNLHRRGRNVLGALLPFGPFPALAAIRAVAAVPAFSTRWAGAAVIQALHFFVLFEEVRYV